MKNLCDIDVPEALYADCWKEQAYAIDAPKERIWRHRELDAMITFTQKGATAWFEMKDLTVRTLTTNRTLENAVRLFEENEANIEYRVAPLR